MFTGAVLFSNASDGQEWAAVKDPKDLLLIPDNELKLKFTQSRLRGANKRAQLTTPQKGKNRKRRAPSSPLKVVD